jgi:serine/threonine protein kinase
MAEQGSLNGQKIGSYLIQGVLGTGGMGTVYRAQDLRLGRAVAIKVINAGQGAPGFAARFQREARVLAQLDHPNILPLWDVGQAGDLLYLVTPVVEGGSLRDLRLRLGGSVPVAQALGLVAQVADALYHAHQRGVVHRDVKPGNLLLHTDGRVMLADFGIARSIHDRPDVSASDLAIGTPHYIAPEQALGDQVDGRADIYSLGAVLYELLSGRTPYVAESTTRVLVQMLDGPPQPLGEVNPWVSPAVQAVVMRAVASQPDDRYQSAAEFAADLRKLLSLGTLFARPSQQTPGRSPAVPPGSFPRMTTPLLPHTTRPISDEPALSLAPQPQASSLMSATPASRPQPQLVVSPPASPFPDQRQTPSVIPGATPSPPPTWRPVAAAPPSSRRSPVAALVITALVILFLGVVFAAALLLNR